MPEIENNEVPVTQSRWKSKLMWAAIIAQVIAIGQLTGIWQSIGVDAGKLGDVLAALLQLGVIVGLINDPTNQTGW